MNLVEDIKNWHAGKGGDMNQLDKRLEESKARLGRAEEALKPNNDMLQHLQSAANKLFYAEEDSDSATAGREAMALPRRGNAFAVIAAAVGLMDKKEVISGIQLFDTLYTKVQLFAVQDSVEDMENEFLCAAHDEVYIADKAEAERYQKRVGILWDLCKPSAQATVLKQIHVNSCMAQAMEDRLAKKTAERKERAHGN